MAASQPKSAGSIRDIFLKDNRIPVEGKLPELNNPKGSMLGHFGMSPVPSVEERRDVMRALIHE